MLAKNSTATIGQRVLTARYDLRRRLKFRTVAFRARIDDVFGHGTRVVDGETALHAAPAHTAHFLEGFQTRDGDIEPLAHLFEQLADRL